MAVSSADHIDQGTGVPPTLYFLSTTAIVFAAFVLYVGLPATPIGAITLLAGPILLPWLLDRVATRPPRCRPAALTIRSDRLEYGDGETPATVVAVSVEAEFRGGLALFVGADRAEPSHIVLAREVSVLGDAAWPLWRNSGVRSVAFRVRARTRTLPWRLAPVVFAILSRLFIGYSNSLLEAVIGIALILSVVCAYGSLFPRAMQDRLLVVDDEGLSSDTWRASFAELSSVEREGDWLVLKAEDEVRLQPIDGSDVDRGLMIELILSAVSTAAARSPGLKRNGALGYAYRGTHEDRGAKG